MLSRIEQLIQFIEDDPEDPFNYYALGLEYSKTDKKRALEIFEQLIKHHKDYIPVYYQLAKLYEQMSQVTHAIQNFREGIVKAREQNDLKTLRELMAGMEELLENGNNAVDQ
jgi:tetratricopeptide (TPR) repeat protein